MAERPPLFLDACANLLHESYEHDREEVIARARAANVAGFLVPGSTLEESLRAADLHRRHPARVWVTAGCHPHHAAAWSDETLRGLESALDHPGVVGVGECGLDYFRLLSPRAEQERAFTEQLALAQRRGRPLLLHVREAHADFLALWREAGLPAERALVHCFTGTAAELEALLSEGFTVGLTGWICDERRGAHLLPLLTTIPRSRLVVETDCPYLLPRDLRPRPRAGRNEPAFLPHIAAVVARAWKTDLEDVAAATTANLRRLFDLPQPVP